MAERKQVLAGHELFRTKMIRGFGFADDATQCIAPPPLDAAAIDPGKSLFVHDAPTLGSASGPFRLRRTLEQLATQTAPVASGVTADSIFLDLWDSQNTAPGAGGSHHCNDVASPSPGGDGGLNGYPVSCRAQDGAQASDATTQIGNYLPIALVNRFDLAHQGWRNCGEHRIIYGRTDGGGTHRNFIIFEAVLPNPKPGCRSACKPVAEFWAGLSTLSPSQRQGKLEKFFYEKNFLPGFAPVVHIDHYTAKGVGSTYGSSGSGQIRTNQFFQQPWMLKEFHLLLDCGSSPCAFEVVPTMVKVNPFGELWDQGIADGAGVFAARAQAFQADLLAGTPTGVQQLASASFDGITYPVDLLFDAAESEAQNGDAPDDFLDVFDRSSAATGFHADFSAAATATGFTADQLVGRATAQSCAGCHQPAGFGPSGGLTSPGAIGNATLVDGTTRDSWPNSLGFVHVSEQLSGTEFPISPALVDVFLPSRKTNLVTRLQEETCACKQTFASLPGPARTKAMEIQERIGARTKERIDALRRRAEKSMVRPPRDPKQLLKLRRELGSSLADLERSGEQELARALVEANITMAPHGLDVTVQPDRVEGVAGDAKQARARRQQHVLDQLAAEPPRRTVNGSFRVH
ncbi:MAG: hypothetical protein IAG13_38125 [Deltaproteobacteria bacterium]|nr:hypothetical protein [Nannocystaceae bacterium]